MKWFSWHHESWEPPGQFLDNSKFFFSLVLYSRAGIKMLTLKNISSGTFWKKSLFVKICRVCNICCIGEVHMLHMQHMMHMRNTGVSYATYVAYAKYRCCICEICCICEVHVLQIWDILHVQHVWHKNIAFATHLRMQHDCLVACFKATWLWNHQSWFYQLHRQDTLAGNFFYISQTY